MGGGRMVDERRGRRDGRRVVRRGGGRREGCDGRGKWRWIRGAI